MSKRPCPECGREVFDSALACEWCGAVLTPAPTQARFQRKNAQAEPTDWSWGANKNVYIFLLVATCIGLGYLVNQLEIGHNVPLNANFGVGTDVYYGGPNENEQAHFGRIKGYTPDGKRVIIENDYGDVWTPTREELRNNPNNFSVKKER